MKIWVVDHINGDKLDNGINNLRLATASQNNLNRGIVSTNTSVVSNIYFSKYHDRWIVDLRSNGKHHIRHCDTMEIAVEKSAELKKEFPDTFHFNR